MKKPNRRSKRASVADSSPPSSIRHDKEEQQQHCGNRVEDLEKENENLKREIEHLKSKFSNISPDFIDSLQNRKEKEDADSRKFLALEEEVMHLRKKLNGLYQFSGRKQHSSQKIGDACLSTMNETQRLKAQKVQLLCKMKLESVQFRLSKASLEKQVLQLSKEQRRKDYEIRKLLAVNEKQKLVLQRKKEESLMASKRLKELLESRKASPHRTSDAKSNQGPGVQGIELELKIAARVEEIRADFDRQMEEMADEVRKYEEEAEMLKEENFRLLLQEKEADSTIRESELKELKEEVFKLSNIVNQLGISKSEVHRKQLDVVHVKPSVSYGSNHDLLDTLESDYSGSNNAVGKSIERVCCSCGKRSLCKTSKCECVASSGSCGTGCGCTASRCTNRGTTFFKMGNDSHQQEVVQDKVPSPGTSETGEAIVVSPPAEFHKDDMPRRKPLSEIGNTVVKPSPKKPGKKMRGRRQVIQPDIVVESSISMTEIAESAKKKGGIDMAVAEKPIRFTRGKRAAV